MIQITVAFGSGTPITWVFGYSSMELADEACSQWTQTGVLRDEYGQILNLGRPNALAVLVEDTDKSMELHIARGLANMRTQVRANGAAQKDIELRNFMAAQRALAGGMNGQMIPMGAPPRI